MKKTTRRVPPSSAKPTGERNKRREGLVKGAPAAQGMFSLSVTDRHAAHLPLPMDRPRVGRLKATSTKRQVRAIGYCDYRPGDRTLPDRVRCGRIGSEAGLLPTLANALYGPMGGFSRNPVNVRSSRSHHGTILIDYIHNFTSLALICRWRGRSQHNSGYFSEAGSIGSSGASTVSMVAAQTSAANSSMSTGCTDREEISGMWDL